MAGNKRETGLTGPRVPECKIKEFLERREVVKKKKKSANTTESRVQADGQEQ